MGQAPIYIKEGNHDSWKGDTCQGYYNINIYSSVMPALLLLWPQNHDPFDAYPGYSSLHHTGISSFTTQHFLLSAEYFYVYAENPDSIPRTHVAACNCL